MIADNTTGQKKCVQKFLCSWKMHLLSGTVLNKRNLLVYQWLIGADRSQK